MRSKTLNTLQLAQFVHLFANIRLVAGPLSRILEQNFDNNLQIREKLLSPKLSVGKASL